MSDIEIPKGYTLGPWVIGPKLHGFDFSVVNPKGDAEFGNWLVAGARWEANARLIALAPEMADEIVRLRAEVARLNGDLEHADLTISAFNSGKVLQDLMEENNTIRAEVERKDAALREIGGLDDQSECCGVGVYSHIGNPPECCGQPLYGLDQAKKVARAALTAQEKTDG